jgi:hypothetical protein
VSARDGIGIAIGASLSFFLSLLATAKDPTPVLRWGLGISLAGLVIFALWELARGPWISVHVTPVAAVPEGVVVSVGLKNNGDRATDPKIIDLLIPDTIPMDECWPDGTVRQGVPPLLHTPESVDDVNESHYWHRSLALPPDSSLVFLRIACASDEFTMRVNIDNVRRDFYIDPRNLNLTQDATFARVRPFVSRALLRVMPRNRRQP